MKFFNLKAMRQLIKINNFNNYDLLENIAIKF